MIRILTFIIALLCYSAIHAGETAVAESQTVGKSSVPNSLGSPFGDNMVLQCGQPVPVWGWNEPGTEVSVAFAAQTKRAIANADGKWSLKLDILTANSEPQSLTITTPDKQHEIKNVLVGEVWYASGQSNMRFPLSHSTGSKKFIAQAENPHLRFVRVPNESSPDAPRDQIDLQWKSWDSETVPVLSACAFHFARWLQRDLDVPVGIIDCAWGGSKVQAWIPKDRLIQDPAWSAVQQHQTEGKRAYQVAVKKWKASGKQGKQPSKMGIGPQHLPSALDNGMASPIIPFAIAGAIWYQGESDSWMPKQYRTLFPSMVKSWRERWDSPELPIYYVQLPNFNKQKVNWAKFRQMQLELLDEMDNVGMAVTIDVGDPKDIHPKNKQPVGNRLARLALHYTYGRREIYPSGPLPVRASRDGDRVLIQFMSVGEGLKVKDSERGLPWFGLLGEDGKGKQATAEIIGKDVIALTCPEINEPVEVRYAFGNNPFANLFNSHNLPASPFRLVIEQ